MVGTQMSAKIVRLFLETCEKKVRLVIIMIDWDLMLFLLMYA